MWLPIHAGIKVKRGRLYSSSLTIEMRSFIKLFMIQIASHSVAKVCMPVHDALYFKLKGSVIATPQITRKINALW